MAVRMCGLVAMLLGCLENLLGGQSSLERHEEELRRSEEISRQRAAKKRREAEAAEIARKKAKLVAPGRQEETPRSGGSKKKMDATCAPCHGIVYHGSCKKPDCPFDHDEGRCKAFKEAHPDGPPARK